MPSTREVAGSVRGGGGTSQQCELIKRARGQRDKTPTQECANKCEKCECRASETRPDYMMMSEKIPCKWAENSNYLQRFLKKFGLETTGKIETYLSWTDTAIRQMKVSKKNC